MLDALWSFLKDPDNQKVLAWIGGGIVAVAGGIWAVVKFIVRKPEGGTPDSVVKADNGSVAIGGSATDSPINIGNRSSRKP